MSGGGLRWDDDEERSRGENGAATGAELRCAPMRSPAADAGLDFATLRGGRFSVERETSHSCAAPGTRGTEGKLVPRAYWPGRCGARAPLSARAGLQGPQARQTQRPRSPAAWSAVDCRAAARPCRSGRARDAVAGRRSPVALLHPGRLRWPARCQTTLVGATTRRSRGRSSDRWWMAHGRRLRTPRPAPSRTGSLCSPVSAQRPV